LFSLLEMQQELVEIGLDHFHTLANG
jgi:hypothetical protein